MSEEKMLKTMNPANGKSLKDYKMMTDNEMNSAVKSCHEAFLKWKNKSAEERAKIISNIGKKLEENKDELVKLMTNEMGKLLKQGGTGS